MALTLEANVVDGGFVANAGDDVLELPSARLVKEDVVRDDCSDAVPHCHVRQFVQPQLVVRRRRRQSET